MNINEDCLELKVFVAELRNMNIESDTIDIYCIYTKLKIIDDFEAISIRTLEDEIKMLGSAKIDIHGAEKANAELNLDSGINLPEVHEDDEDYSGDEFDDEMEDGFISNRIENNEKKRKY